MTESFCFSFPLSYLTDKNWREKEINRIKKIEKKKEKERIVEEKKEESKRLKKEESKVKEEILTLQELLKKYPEMLPEF